MFGPPPTRLRAASLLIPLVLGLELVAPASAARHNGRRMPLSFLASDSLTNDLRRESKATRIPDLLYGKGDRNLPDLIFHFPKPPSSPQVFLVVHGKTQERLCGARNLWALVFVSDPSLIDPFTDTVSTETQTSPTRGKPIVRVHRAARTLPAAVENALVSEHTTRTDSDLPQPEPKPKSDAGVRRPNGGTAAGAPTDSEVVTKTTETDIQHRESGRIRLEALAYQPGIGENAVIGGLSKIFGVSPPAPSGPPPDVDSSLAFERIDSSATDPIYYAPVKFPLTENTINRLRVALGNQRVYATVPNYSASWVGISLGAVAVWPKSRDPNLHALEVEPHLLFHFYIERPYLPGGYEPFYRRMSVAGVLGTRFESPLKNIFLGMAVGHLLGQLQVDAGYELSKETRGVPVNTGDTGNYIRGRFAAGLSYAL